MYIDALNSVENPPISTDHHYTIVVERRNEIYGEREGDSEEREEYLCLYSILSNSGALTV